MIEHCGSPGGSVRLGTLKPQTNISPAAPGHGRARSGRGGGHYIAGTQPVKTKKSLPWMKLPCVTCEYRASGPFDYVSDC